MEYTDVLINIRKIIRSINLESKRIQKEHGISIPQYLSLNYLNNCPEFRGTSKDIKAYLNLNASTVSGIIHRLENKGYIAKLPNVGDRRSAYIYLTALGKEAIDKVPKLLHQKLSIKLQSLSKTELTQLQSSLDTLVQFMEVDDVDASPLLTPGENIVSE